LVTSVTNININRNIFRLLNCYPHSWFKLEDPIAQES
jgi:hypothetical protein